MTRKGLLDESSNTDTSNTYSEEQEGRVDAVDKDGDKDGDKAAVAAAKKKAEDDLTKAKQVSVEFLLIIGKHDA